MGRGIGLTDLDLFQNENEIRDVKFKSSHFLTPPNPAQTPLTQQCEIYSISYGSDIAFIPDHPSAECVSPSEGIFASRLTLTAKRRALACNKTATKEPG
jgi:hypothetical protein